ncbi:hypothetical protein V2J09_009670 [Rumex salicifolius]
MEVHAQIPLVVITFILLVHFNGFHGRPIQTAHHPGVHHNDHHLIDTVFFHQKDLKPGNSIDLSFPVRYPNKTPKFLPKSVSDSLPFSLADLPTVLQTLGIDHNSSQADLMAETLAHCEKPPVYGEFKFCATSLESMLESVRGKLGFGFGSGSSAKLLTTSSLAEYRGLQRFKIIGDPKEIEAPNAIGCHQMSYPYAVFYCHTQKGSNKLYELETETERDGQRIRVRILGMCHMDTSHWDPDLLSFKMLGTRPGEEPVCHAFSTDSLVWVPKQNSVVKSVV